MEREPGQASEYDNWVAKVLAKAAEKVREIEAYRIRTGEDRKRQRSIITLEEELGRLVARDSSDPSDGRRLI